MFCSPTRHTFPLLSSQRQALHVTGWGSEVHPAPYPPYPSPSSPREGEEGGTWGLVRKHIGPRTQWSDMHGTSLMQNPGF